MGMDQHQNDLTSDMGQHETLRPSEGEGSSLDVNRHSGYGQESFTADHNVDYGAPILHDKQQQDTISGTRIGEPSQHRAQHAVLPEQGPSRYRQSGYGHRVTQIHFNELSGVWSPGDRLHIPVIAQCQNGQKVLVNGKAVVMTFVRRNSTIKDLIWERRLVGFDGA